MAVARRRTMLLSFAPAEPRFGGCLPSRVRLRTAFVYRSLGPSESGSRDESYGVPHRRDVLLGGGHAASPRRNGTEGLAHPKKYRYSGFQARALRVRPFFGVCSGMGQHDAPRTASFKDVPSALSAFASAAAEMAAHPDDSDRRETLEAVTRGVEHAVAAVVSDAEFRSRTLH